LRGKQAGGREKDLRKLRSRGLGEGSRAEKRIKRKRSKAHYRRGNAQRKNLAKKKKKKKEKKTLVLDKKTPHRKQ